MTDPGCRAWQGRLAMRAMGRSEDDGGAALDAHLDGCAACRDELRQLEAVAAVATLADPERLTSVPSPPPLADRILARMLDEVRADRAERRRRHQRVALAAAAVLVAVALAVASLRPGDSPDAGTTRVELAGSGGVRGSAELAERAWGTEVTLEVAGLKAGERYWLWLTDRAGDRVAAGSLSGTGRSVTAVLAAAMGTDEAARIWLSDEADRVVLDARLAGD